MRLLNYNYGVVELTSQMSLYMQLVHLGTFSHDVLSNKIYYQLMLTLGQPFHGYFLLQQVAVVTRFASKNNSVK